MVIQIWKQPLVLGAACALVSLRIIFTWIISPIFVSYIVPFQDCSQASTRYEGPDLETIASGSAEDCQDKCFENLECTHYTWVDNSWPLSDKCYLKSNLPSKVIEAGFISGMRMWREMGK